MIRKKRPVHVHQEVLTIHAGRSLPNACSEQLLTDGKGMKAFTVLCMKCMEFSVEEDIDSVRANSPQGNKETFQLPTVPKRCLEAQYSGTTSQPLLTTRSPVTCNVVKHKNQVIVESKVESVTMDTDGTTPSDVTSMSIARYDSPSPTSWCSLPSTDTSPTHTGSAIVTPTHDTNPNPGSCAPSPTHSHLQREHCKLTR